MASFQEQKEQLLTEAAKLHARNELSKDIGPDFFEPGIMEYPEQSDASYDEGSGELVLRFESRGTRYDGRTEQIEKIRLGDVIQITREKENAYNPNNFRLLTEKGKDVGNMPAELCNAVAPLYDSGLLVIESAQVSFVEPISARSRHAKQAILFVEMHARISEPSSQADISEKVVVDNSQVITEAQLEDPYALKLDLTKNSFYIGGREIRRDDLLDDIKKEVFCENAKEVQDLRNADTIYIYLRHLVEFAGEKWVAQLTFRDGQFRDLWLEHAKLFQQKSLLKNAASNPRLRKEHSALFSRMKPRLNEMTGMTGEQETNMGNQQYIYYFDDHSAMLVQDNNLPAIVVYVQYFKKVVESE